MEILDSFSYKLEIYQQNEHKCFRPIKNTQQNSTNDRYVALPEYYLFHKARYINLTSRNHKT